MKIAIPMANDQLCLHFGHCEKFALMQVDPSGKAVVATDYEVPGTAISMICKSSVAFLCLCSFHHVNKLLTFP